MVVDERGRSVWPRPQGAESVRREAGAIGACARTPTRDIGVASVVVDHDSVGSTGRHVLELCGQPGEARAAGHELDVADASEPVGDGNLEDGNGTRRIAKLQTDLLQGAFFDPG